MVNYGNLGENLKNYRIQNGLSIKKLNSLLTSLNFPISSQSIYKWESNKATPDINILNTLANIYNISISCFFNNNGKIQSLNNTELKLIEYLHKYKIFRRIVYSMIKLNKRWEWWKQDYQLD